MGDETFLRPGTRKQARVGLSVLAQCLRPGTKAALTSRREPPNVLFGSELLCLVN